MSASMSPSPELVGSPLRFIPAAAPGLCLDYANTLCWRGLPTPTETLRGCQDLMRWCTGAGVALDPAFGPWSVAQAAAAALVFAEAIAMREMLYRVLSALAVGARIPRADVRALNEALARAPPRGVIAERGTTYVWRVEQRTPRYSAPGLLTPVLWSAADLIVGQGRPRVRQCANEACRWLFLDASRSGSRRWCDMRSCGNRAKAHRHYQKHRAREPAAQPGRGKRTVRRSFSHSK